MNRDIQLMIDEYTKLFNEPVPVSDKDSFIRKQKKLEKLSEKIKTMLAETRKSGTFDAIHGIMQS